MRCDYCFERKDRSCSVKKNRVLTDMKENRPMPAMAGAVFAADAALCAQED